MESPNNNIKTEKRKFRLHEHPWLSLLAGMITIVVAIIWQVVWCMLSDYPPT